MLLHTCMCLQQIMNYFTIKSNANQFIREEDCRQLSTANFQNKDASLSLR